MALEEINKDKNINDNFEARLFTLAAIASPIAGPIVGYSKDGWEGAGIGLLAGIGGAYVFGWVAYAFDSLGHKSDS